MSRLRILDRRTNLSYTSKADIWDKLGGNCSLSPAWRTYGSNSGTIDIGSYTTMNDVVVPGYHHRSHRGEVFFNPMLRVTQTISEGSGQTPVFQANSSSCSGAQLYYMQYRYPLTGASVGRLRSGFAHTVNPDGSCRVYNSIIDPRDVAAGITEAATSCLNNRGRGDTNLYETIAEADKILGTVPGIVKPALQSLLKNRGLLSRARSAGSAYLAYRYGLKPLMSDLEAVKKGLEKVVGKVRKTSRGSVTLNGNKTTTRAGEYGGACSTLETFTTSETLLIRAMSLDEYDASVASNIGLTNKGLVTLPWELLPYSFVVDWFVNIGDYFGAMIPLLDTHQLGSCLVQEGTQVTQFSISNPIANANLTMTQPVSGSCEQTWSYKSRVAGPLSAGIVIKADFRLTNALRAADAISLILQRIR